MNNPEIKIHYYQKSILKNLTLNPIQRFNDLLIEGLESEHMNYHLKQLIEFGLVNKSDIGYYLTDFGKDYCNLLDDNIEIIEKQPKTSIIIWGVRKNDKTDEIEHLLNKRLRQPYFGKIGRITGKVRFGETLQQAAERELFEEAGLTAKSFTLDKIYHKLRHREDGGYVQDVIFYIFFVTDFEGTLIEKSEFQENFWMSKHELQKHKDFDLYDDFSIDERVVPNPKPIFTETDDIAQGY